MRRYFRFSLKQLMLLTLVVAVACAGVSHRVAALRSFEATMHRTGGYALIDAPHDWFHRCGLGELTDQPVYVDLSAETSRTIERFPIGMIGDVNEPLTDVDVFFLTQGTRGANAETCAANDETLAEVAAFADTIVTLNLQNPSITDHGIKSLSRFGRLRCLMLGPAVTDQGLESLSPLKDLQIVYIADGTRITIKGLRNLSRHPSLKLVRGSNLPIDRNDLKALQAASPGIQFDIVPAE
jgi:hypothetical protein